MRVLTSSHSDHRSSARRCFAGSFFHAFSAGWQGANAGAIGAGVPMIPKPGLRRLAYSLLLLGTVASAAGIWVKLWNPSCSVVSGV